MRAVLPGRPPSKRQALSTAYWDGLRIVAYISGNAAIIASGPQTILQTIYIDSVETLIAVTIDETSGRIALCDEKYVCIYDAIGRDEGLLRWSQSHDLTNNDEENNITSLSWSSPEELLIGGSVLRLWYIPESNLPKVIWEQELPYPTSFAYVSHDGALIASCGQHDRIVKIWRRLSYEVDSTRYDVSYLSHPSAVTNVHWRKPWHREQNLDNLLYTFCADNHVRVWSYSDMHSLTLMQPVAEVDMSVSIQPRRLSVGSVSRRRFAFIIDSRDFSSATEKAVQNAPAQKIDHALEHLIEIANRSPEICIVLDGIGHMSAWGLENVGCKNKNPTVVFNIAIVDGMNIPLPKQDHPLEDFYQVCVFAGGVTKSSLSLLVHSYTGSINWYDSQITNLFDTSSRQDRAQLVTSWTGHDDLVEKIVRDTSGRNICSWTEDGDVIVWRHDPAAKSVPLLMRCSFTDDGGVLDAIFSHDGDHLVILKGEEFTIMRLTSSHATSIAGFPLDEDKDPISFMQVERKSKDPSMMKFGIIYEDHSFEIWQIHLLTREAVKTNGNGHVASKILANLTPVPDDAKVVVFSTTETGYENEYTSPALYPACVLSVDGEIYGFKYLFDIDQNRHQLIAGDKTPTTVRKSSLAGAMSSGKVAIVGTDKKSISIWDLRSSVCEFEHEFEGSDTIERLAWANTDEGHLVLAVGFAFQIDIFTQQRFSSLASKDAWIQFQHIRMRNYTTHAVGDICLLGDGSIVVGAGNQLVVLSMTFEPTSTTNGEVREDSVKREPMSALHRLAMYNTVLPIIHHEFLHLLLSFGRFSALRRIVRLLHHILKYFAEGDAFSSTLDHSIDDVAQLISDGNQAQGHNSLASPDTVNGFNHSESGDFIPVEELNRLQETLEKNQLPIISTQEQSKLREVIEVAKELQSLEASLDENGLRYVHALYSHKHSDLPWSAIMFATLSTSQEILTDLVTRFFGGKLTWEAARKSGLFLWLSDPDALQTQFENVARAEYTKNEDRNPVDCSLYYLALGKKNVLQGLWRMTHGVREKENTIKLLANNFKEPRWKATALKNAYALLSKRRFEYGAAFFLLADSLKDAANVCIHQLKDLQLAIAISRVYHDRDESVIVLRKIVSQSVLSASCNSDQARWMASWAYYFLNDIEKAVQVIVRPVYQVINAPTSEDSGIPRSLSYRINDPILTVLYLQLRSQLIKKNSWRGVVTPKEEWDFVMRCVRQYLRMGCDVFGLALVKNWDFVPESSIEEQKPFKPDETVTAQNDIFSDYRDEPAMLPEPTDKKKPPPTQFEEPSASSLLDSFGF